MRSTLFLFASISLLIVAPQAGAQTVDMSFSPSLSIVEIGDTVEVQLNVFANGVTDIDFAALDALLDYDPAFLLLVGVDDTLSAETWFASAFLPDPDGINDSISDGNALYTALSNTAIPAVAPAGGAIVTSFQFIALQETSGTVISLLPNMGVWASTEVYDFYTPGVTLTGDISSTANVRIVAGPTVYCLGEPAACPCLNPGGPGEGCQNSTGQGAMLTASGTVSVTQDDLMLQAAQVPANAFGMFIIGGGASNQPFGDGLLCVSPGPTGLHRFAPPQQSTFSGMMNLGPGIVAYTTGFPSGQEIQVGMTYFFQTWYRNPSGPCSSGWNMSNAIEITFTP